MEVFEYYGRVSEDGRLDFPEALRMRIRSNKKLRVMVFLEDEDPDWNKMAALNFLDGYSDEDSIYDTL